MKTILINENAVKELSRMASNAIDVIVTDPPYRVISGGEAKGYGILEKNDGKIMEHNNIDIDEYSKHLFRVLKDRGHCYIMTNLLNLFHFRDSLLAAGFQLHNLLVWQKNNSTPNRWYMKNAEFTLFLRKGKAKTINNADSKMVHAFDNVMSERLHPTQKPTALMRMYIENSSSIGDIVLDPFMGSGSTGVAAMESGRNFIGIEIDEKYFSAAKKRMSSE